MAYLTLEHLSFSYPDLSSPALDDLCLDIEAGQFIALIGASGCGKTTLLRQLKPSLSPAGARKGRVLLAGRPLTELSARDDAGDIGFILQDPASQIVTGQVASELAFCLENLGVASEEIRLRVAEMASFFGIQEWFDRPVEALSGGQKQLLNLAAVMVSQPALLLCDEPTAQLDPIAAAHFLTTLSRINEEIGTTVIICEQRLEEVVPLADRVLALDGGRLVADAAPERIGAELLAAQSPLFAALPTPIRVFCGLELESSARTPTTVREGRAWLQTRLAAANPARDVASDRPARPTPPHEPSPPGEAARAPGAKPLLSVRDVWFRYERNAPDALRGLNLDLYPGELTALVGGNGAGKTTALGVIAGLLKPWRGRVKRNERLLAADGGANAGTSAVALLPQDPRLLFTHKTVRAELDAAASLAGSSADDSDRRAREVARQCEIEELLDRHPFDVSGGEAQRIALADVLLTRPRLLLLDEPTKGMDASFKQRFAATLRQLITDERITVVMVSHDIEFCARHADRCCLFFNGQAVANAPARPFFAGMRYYTTAARRISRGLLPDAITASDIRAAVTDREDTGAAGAGPTGAGAGPTGAGAGAGAGTP